MISLVASPGFLGLKGGIFAGFVGISSASFSLGGRKVGFWLGKPAGFPGTPKTGLPGCGCGAFL